MKLILAIIQDEDAHEVISALNDAKFQVTRLNTKGGFLRAGNTTLLVGVDDVRFDSAMAVIEKVCKSRKQLAPSPATMAGTVGGYSPYPVEVTVGGATVFVMNVEQFVKM